MGSINRIFRRSDIYKTWKNNPVDTICKALPIIELSGSLWKDLCIRAQDQKVKLLPGLAPPYMQRAWAPLGYGSEQG